MSLPERIASASGVVGPLTSALSYFSGCGGPWGYVDYLAAITDLEHERHEELLEWREPFDPLAFDAKKATKAMRRVK